jgi:AAA15 family ATPase/GTPase
MVLLLGENKSGKTITLKALYGGLSSISAHGEKRKNRGLANIFTEYNIQKSNNDKFQIAVVIDKYHAKLLVNDIVFEQDWSE